MGIMNIPSPKAINNTLTSTSTTEALSANQGRVLNSLIPAKASASEATTGTNDTKFMTPLRVKELVNLNKTSKRSTFELYISGDFIKGLGG